MIQVKEISVSDIFGSDALYIDFTISDTKESLDNYRFDLYKSNSQTQDFTLLAYNVKDFHYKDTGVELFDIMVNYYYKVKITDLRTNESVLSEIGEYKGRKPDNESLTILHIHEVYLQRVIMNKMLLVKRKRHGQVCTCFDDIRRRSNPVFCDVCYGTKYISGYLSPIEMPVNFVNNLMKHERFDVSNVTEEEMPSQLWTQNFPLIQVNDFFVDIDDNTRFIVTNVQHTYRHYYLLRQVIQMSKVPSSNVFYHFPILR